MENNIEQSLQEVRKAYRLIYDYQSRVLDLMSYIEKKINFNFDSGWPLFSNAAPRKGSGKLDNWAWDWLNMYYYHFFFGELKVKSDILRFGIVHMADSGYFDFSSDKKNKAELKNYKPIKESKSKLIFVIGRNSWSKWGENWNHIDFTTKEEGQTDEDRLIFRSYDLSRFSTEDSTACVLKDFHDYCKVYNIDFTVKENTINN